MTDDWPAVGLDIERLTAAGWRSTPFSQFILKLVSRCNIACDYCYMYTMADQSWRSRPKIMSQAVLERTAERIADHARAHELRAVEIVLHGGEPLLVGAAPLDGIVGTLREAMPSDVSLAIQVQTNGILLDTAILDVLLKHRIQVSVSLDGTPETHDRHRRYANGNGSYQRVARGLRLLAGEPYRELFAGLLCVIDVTADPVGTYEALLSFAPPKVNFLLPHGNWSSPPPRRPAGSAETPYGDWLVAVFDHWYDAAGYDTDVQLFTELINVLLGGTSRTESIGLSPVGMVGVDTDGTMEQVDTLRSTYHGAADTGLNVLRDSFDTALLHPTVVARQIGVDALGTVCRDCEIRRICGGGNYAHRFGQGTGFRNPSVYCPDLDRLIRHVERCVRAEVTAMAARSVAGDGQ